MSEASDIIAELEVMWVGISAVLVVKARSFQSSANRHQSLFRLCCFVDAAISSESFEFRAGCNGPQFSSLAFCFVHAAISCKILAGRATTSPRFVVGVASIHKAFDVYLKSFHLTHGIFDC